MNKILFALPLLLTVGCGVSDDTLLSEIEDDLWVKICDKATAGLEDSPEIDCGEGVIIPASDATTASECVDGNTETWDNCDATFGEWKACQDFEATDPCDFEGTATEAEAVCGWVADCLAAM